VRCFIHKDGSLFINTPELPEFCLVPYQRVYLTPRWGIPFDDLSHIRRIGQPEIKSLQMTTGGQYNMVGQPADVFMYLHPY